MITCIAGVHALAAIALVCAGGVHVVMEKAPPLVVRLMPAAPPARPAQVAKAVPLPSLRPPEVRLPDPPPIELQVTHRPEPIAQPVAPLSVAAVAGEPAPIAPTAPPAPAVLEPPRGDLAYLDNPAPAYPQAAKRAGEQGRVMLRVRVSAAGEVEAIDVQQSSGFERLDEAARAAVRRWRFAPARLAGRAVAGIALVPISFSLRGT